MERQVSEGSEIYTWGSGEMGQLGYPASEIMQLPKDQEGYPFQPSPNKVHFFKNFQIAQVSGGDGHSLAVTRSGKVYAWGASACGQLGLQDIPDMPTDAEGYPYQPEPKMIESMQEHFIVQVACGDAHTIALTNAGLVFSWGGGGCGQLGHRDTNMMPKDEDGCPYQPSPRLVEDITCKVKHISCGKAHTVAVAEEGQIFTWGAGACGQLGHPDTSSFPFDEDGYPFHPTPRAVTSLRTARIIMAAWGDVHTLALTDEGAVYCFGGGSFGQLGLGAIKNLPVDVDEWPFMPVPKQIESIKHTRIIQLSCGDSHSMALSDGGELYGWGAAACGQLGIEDLNHLPKDSESSPYEPDPQLIKSLRGKLVTSVSWGEAHTLALTNKGCVYSFGASNWGQLGLKMSEFLDSQTQRRSQNENKLVSYQAVPKLITGLLNKQVVSISSGGVHNVVICEAPTQTLINDFYDCYLKQTFTDFTFTLVSSGCEETVGCHKVIFACKSHHFRKILKSTNDIRIHQNKASLLKLIDFFYLDNMNTLEESVNTCSNLTELIQFAHTYHLTELKQVCRQKFQANLLPYFPNKFPSNMEISNFVFLPDGRGLLLDPETYQNMLKTSVVFSIEQDQIPEPQPDNPLPSLSESILKELNNEDMSDVSLKIGETLIHCHKIVLAARSEFFSALFTHTFRESREKTVEIKEFSVENMMLLLKYIYSDSEPIDMSAVADLLNMCDRFSIPSLRARIESLLSNTLTIENSSLLFKYAKGYQCPKLKTACLEFIDQFYNSVIATPGFEDLDKESIMEIMRYKHS